MRMYCNILKCIAINFAIFIKIQLSFVLFHWFDMRKNPLKSCRWNNHRNISANLNHIFDVCNHEPEPKFRARAYLPIYMYWKNILQYFYERISINWYRTEYFVKIRFNSEVTNRICLFQLTAQQLMQTMSSPRQPMIPIDVSWRGGAQKRASDYTIEPDDGFG